MQGVGPARDVRDGVAHDGRVPRRADGRLPLRPAEPVRGAVLVHGEVLDRGGALDGRRLEQPRAPPAGDLRQQGDVLVGVPALQLVAFVRVDGEAQDDEDVVRGLRGDGLEGREGRRLLAGDEVVEEAADGDLLHGVLFALRLDAVGAQGGVGLLDELRRVGHVVDGEPFREALAGAGAVEVGGAVAEAVGEEGQAHAEGGVLVVPPVVKLGGGEAGVRCHGHVEEAGGGGHVGGWA